MTLGLIGTAVTLKRSVTFVLIFNWSNLEELETAIRGQCPSAFSRHVALPRSLGGCRGRPSPSRVFLNNMRTVSQGGAPDGEGNSPGHGPAAPASKGGGGEGGCSFLCDSWHPGSTVLRPDRMGGEWLCHQHECWGPLPFLLHNQCAWTHYGDAQPGCPAKGWSSLLGLSSGEFADWNMQGRGSSADFLLSVWDTFTVSLTRASCRGLEKNLSITDPIRQTVKVKVLVAQSCPTLCDPMNCSPPGSSVHGIFQARILRWVAILFSRESSQPWDQTWVSCPSGRFLTIWTSFHQGSLIRQKLGWILLERCLFSCIILLSAAVKIAPDLRNL